MKRSVILMTLLFCILLIINSICAVEITLSKSTYQPGETLQAEIVGNFIDPLDISNIHLRKLGSPKSIPVQKELVLQYPKYYLYMTPLPNEEGNVSLRIEDTQYMQGGEVKTENIIKEVDILQTGSLGLYYNPGFVLATEDFIIDVKSLYGSQELNAEFSASGETHNFFAIEDVIYTLSFSIQELVTQTTNININGENIPVFITHELPPEPIPELNCSELGGEVCLQDWTCDITVNKTIDTDFCCLGNCAPPPDCEANCSGKQCGGDGCGGTCGNCTQDYSNEFYCDSDFICINSTIPCTSKCNESGELGCFGSYLKTCGNYDIDNCLEWDNASLCDWGCFNNSCLPEPGYSDIIFLSVSKTSPVLSAKVLPDKDYPFEVVLENIGTAAANNITVYTDLGFVVSHPEISLNPNQRQVVTIYVNVDGTIVEEGDRFSGSIIAEINNINTTFPIYLEITLEQANEVITGTSITTSYTCADQNGLKCPDDTECDIDTISSSDSSSCCPGKCVEPKSGGSWWIIGIILVGIVILIVVIGFIKSKKQSTSPKNKLDERKKNFEQRMKPNPKPIPTSGSLGKI